MMMTTTTTTTTSRTSTTTGTKEKRSQQPYFYQCQASQSSIERYNELFSFLSLTATCTRPTGKVLNWDERRLCHRLHLVKEQHLFIVTTISNCSCRPLITYDSTSLTPLPLTLTFSVSLFIYTVGIHWIYVWVLFYGFQGKGKAPCRVALQWWARHRERCFETVTAVEQATPSSTQEPTWLNFLALSLSYGAKQSCDSNSMLPVQKDRFPSGPPLRHRHFYLPSRLPIDLAPTLTQPRRDISRPINVIFHFFPSIQFNIKSACRYFSVSTCIRHQQPLDVVNLKWKQQEKYKSSRSGCCAVVASPVAPAASRKKKRDIKRHLPVE